MFFSSSKHRPPLVEVDVEAEVEVEVEVEVGVDHLVKMQLM